MKMEMLKRSVLVLHVKYVAEKRGTCPNYMWESIPERVYPLEIVLLCRLVSTIAKYACFDSLKSGWKTFLEKHGETAETIKKGILEVENELKETEERYAREKKEREDKERKMGITPDMSDSERFDIRHRIKLDSRLAELKEMGDEKLDEYKNRLEGQCLSREQTLRHNNEITQDAATNPLLAACGARGRRARSNLMGLGLIGQDDDSVVGQRDDESLRKYCEELTKKESGLASDDWYFSLWLHTF